MQKQITILGRSYTLRADEDDHLEHAAADVERRLRTMLNRSPNFDSYTAALLTALNLASELRAIKMRYRTRIEQLDHAAAAVEAVLEAAVEDEGDEPTGGGDRGQD